MATRHGLVSGKVYRRRDTQVREHVITLVKYLETVIHDIKYVVGDLQILLEQIDLVSRQLDDCSSLPTSSPTRDGSQPARCACSAPLASPSAFTNPLLTRAKRASGSTKRIKRTAKPRKYMHEETSSPVSWSSCEGSMPRRKESNASEMDKISVELNAMWDNAFDSDLLTGSWTQGAVNHPTGYFDHRTKPDEPTGLSGRLQNNNLAASQGTSWLDTTNLEQSLTSGIEMLSFTDDSEEDCLSSALSFFPSGDDVSVPVCIEVDPYHVSCKDVIPAGSGRTYCGVYEAALDACLETFSDMSTSDSFTSDVSLFGGEDLDSVVSGIHYEPRYDTQLNTWTAFTMVPIESLHTSEDDLSETALDILNDNVPSSPVLDNVKKTINANTDTVSSTEADTRHLTSTVDGLGQSTNAYILSC